MSLYALDVTEATFQTEVIEKSRTVPVLVDFWAEWCGPCRALKPVLEKLAGEYGGKFVLAKVDSDKNQSLAMKYGVRGIPNVKAFVDGAMVDEFSGAIPESAAREFIDRLIPSEADKLRQQALSLHVQGQSAEALTLLSKAHEMEPSNDRVKIDAAAFEAEAGNFDAARRWLADLHPASQGDPRVEGLLAQLEFAGNAEAIADVATLQKAITADENNLQARLDLSRRLVVERRYEEALDQLLEIIKRDRRFQDDIGRKTMLSVFNLLSDQPALVARYRRLMASALH